MTSSKWNVIIILFPNCDNYISVLSQKGFLPENVELAGILQCKRKMRAKGHYKGDNALFVPKWRIFGGLTRR